MIELQYFERIDFKQLIEWITSPEFLLQWGGSGFSFPLDEKQLELYLSEANTPTSNTLLFRVFDTDIKKIVGHISLGQIDRKNQSARIGKVLVGEPSMRGRGIGQNMMRSLLDIAFGDLKLHRISLGVFDFNKSAIAMYKKAGFKLEGTLRDARKMGGKYWNLCEMSILAYEWEAIKKVDPITCREPG